MSTSYIFISSHVKERGLIVDREEPDAFLLFEVDFILLGGPPLYSFLHMMFCTFIFR